MAKDTLPLCTMIKVKKFTFNPFAENTYVLVSEKGNAWIVDPGCSDNDENQEVLDFLDNNHLSLKGLLLTHAHIDHVLGNHFIYKTFGHTPVMHEADLEVLRRAEQSASMYGVPYLPSPEPEEYINDGDNLDLDGTSFEVKWCPGHAPGHVVFINHDDRYIIGGDVLFRGSIGRTDLPGGDHDTLLDSIKNKLYVLPDNYTVFCGHGPETTIGFEKENNPFIRA